MALLRGGILMRAFGLAWCLVAIAAVAHPTDSITSLIRQQTDLTSNAGQKGDQATVDRFTHDAILFSAGDGTVQRDKNFDSVGALSDALERLSAAFHRAPKGAFSPTLAHSTLFIDETGALNHASDFSAGPGVISDWLMHRVGRVAITSFTLEAGQARYLAVETWYLQGSHWRLMAGQTIPLYKDPQILALSASELDPYIGAYTAGPGSLISVQQNEGGLLLNPSVGQPVVLKASSPDQFFTPDQPAGYLRSSTVFRRDDHGLVTEFERNGIRYSRIHQPAANDLQVSTPPSLTPGELKLRDFVVLHTNDVAVAAFYHDRDTPYFGQVLHQTFRSMETWVKDGTTWKMISSQGRQT